MAICAVSLLAGCDDVAVLWAFNEHPLVDVIRDARGEPLTYPFSDTDFARVCLVARHALLSDHANGEHSPDYSEDFTRIVETDHSGAVTIWRAHWSWIDVADGSFCTDRPSTIRGVPELNGRFRFGLNG